MVTNYFNGVEISTNCIMLYYSIESFNNCAYGLEKKVVVTRAHDTLYIPTLFVHSRKLQPELLQIKSTIKDDTTNIKRQLADERR